MFSSGNFMCFNVFLKNIILSLFNTCLNVNWDMFIQKLVLDPIIMVETNTNQDTLSVQKF